MPRFSASCSWHNPRKGMEMLYRCMNRGHWPTNNPWHDIGKIRLSFLIVSFLMKTKSRTFWEKNIDHYNSIYRSLYIDFFMKAKVWISWNSKELKTPGFRSRHSLTAWPWFQPWFHDGAVIGVPGSRTNATTNVFSRNTWRVACRQCRMPMGTRCMADRWRSAWGVGW